MPRLGDPFVPVLLGRLKVAQASFALANCQRPLASTEFEFGRVHGVVQGYDIVLREIDKMLRDEADAGN